jgi:hypothetical protein
MRGRELYTNRLSGRTHETGFFTAIRIDLLLAISLNLIDLCRSGLFPHPSCAYSGNRTCSSPPIKAKEGRV